MAEYFGGWVAIIDLVIPPSKYRNTIYIISFPIGLLLSQRESLHITNVTYWKISTPLTKLYLYEGYSCTIDFMQFAKFIIHQIG